MHEGMNIICTLLDFLTKCMDANGDRERVKERSK